MSRSSNILKIKQHARFIIDQKISLLSSIDNKKYNERVPSFFNVSVGSHFRHVFDHFHSCLSNIYLQKNDGLDADKEVDEIHKNRFVDMPEEFVKQKSCKICNYDRRSRDTLIERNIDAALVEALRIRREIDTIDPTSDLWSSSMKVSFVGDASTSNGESYEIESNFARELSFVTHHSVHHLAMIRLILESSKDNMTNLNLQEVGIANSTLIHEKKDKIDSRILPNIFEGKEVELLEVRK
jgi:hypothetical protein